MPVEFAADFNIVFFNDGFCANLNGAVFDDFNELGSMSSYRDPNEKKIKLPQEFFSLSCHEKINKLSGGVYDV